MLHWFPLFHDRPSEVSHPFEFRANLSWDYNMVSFFTVNAEMLKFCALLAHFVIGYHRSVVPTHF